MRPPVWGHKRHVTDVFAGALDRRDAVAVLRTLKDSGYRLWPDPIYSWAIANEWTTRGAERRREMAADFEAGKRPRLGGGYPSRSDILDVWRQEAAWQS